MKACKIVCKGRQAGPIRAKPIRADPSRAEPAEIFHSDSIGSAVKNSPVARCVAWCCGGGHVKWCHEVAKPLRPSSQHISCSSRSVNASLGFQNCHRKCTTAIACCSQYRLSHFVAPLYVAPSTTPSNAKPTSEFFTSFPFSFLPHPLRHFFLIPTTQ